MAIARTKGKHIISTAYTEGYRKKTGSERPKRKKEKRIKRERELKERIKRRENPIPPVDGLLR